MDIILGTAGHIDHGKTTLVRALTGMDCDRLDEERRRGITIELGFAWLDLPDGRRLGIVDVPGHERFVKNMVAGAAGIDLVMLVIAADEGVMPQTREHLEICSLLGVKAGLVALTKTDLVDAELLEMARADIENALSGTFLANAPIIPVSSQTGEGMEALAAEIARQAALLRERPKSDIFRLPVDRVFSMKGFGTVATGTIIGGACSQGEKLCVMPTGKEARARSLQAHNVPCDSAHAGQRCAINLQGLEVGDLRRGDTIAQPDTLFPSTCCFVYLHCLKSSPLPIRQRMEAHFHHGTKECLAKVVFRDREALEPGQSAIAEIKFDQPLATVYGDHCVLRAHSPLRVIGGGVVVCPLPPVLRKRNADYRQKLELLRELGAPDSENPALPPSKNPEKLTRISLELCAPRGADFAHLRIMTGLDRATLLAALQGLEASGQAFCWDKATNQWLAHATLLALLEKCRARAEELHRREPLKSFFAPNDFASALGKDLPRKFTQEILAQAIGRQILEEEGSGLKLAGREVKFNKADAKTLEDLFRKIKAGGLTPPFIKDIMEESGLSLKKVQPLLDYLCNSGKILKIQDGVYYAKDEFDKIVKKARAWFEQHAELEIGDVKTVFGLSRKYSIPVMEYLDSIRLTYRVGNKRRLCKN